MIFDVRVLTRAQHDVDGILAWLAERSPAGAARWLAEFMNASASLAVDPQRFAVASECQSLDRDVRERFFKTRRGRRYRLVFTIVGQDVRILRVRGPGQPPLEPSDL